MWAHTPVPTRPSSWVSNATTAGPMTPAIPLRVATENRIARLVNASTGRTVRIHPAVTNVTHRPGLSSWPPRPTSVWLPTSTNPATRLETAVTASRPVANVTAARTFPMNTCSRVQDRVSTVFHVPWRSSDENRSLASTPATNGNPQLPAKLSTTSEIAKPELCTQIPNRVSAGLPLWSPRTTANAKGPRMHTRASRRVDS